jgi:hypothetical protein
VPRPAASHRKSIARLRTAILSDSFISRSVPALAAPLRHADAVSILNTSARVQTLNQVRLIDAACCESNVSKALASTALPQQSSSVNSLTSPLPPLKKQVYGSDFVLSNCPFLSFSQDPSPHPLADSNPDAPSATADAAASPNLHPPTMAAEHALSPTRIDRLHSGHSTNYRHVSPHYTWQSRVCCCCCCCC